MTIRLKDSDDQNPIFTKEIYKTHVLEAAAITVSNFCFLNIVASAIKCEIYKTEYEISRYVLKLKYSTAPEFNIFLPELHVSLN